MVVQRHAQTCLGMCVFSLPLIILMPRLTDCFISSTILHQAKHCPSLQVPPVMTWLVETQVSLGLRYLTSELSKSMELLQRNLYQFSQGQSFQLTLDTECVANLLVVCIYDAGNSPSTWELIQGSGNTGSHLSGDFSEYRIHRFILKFSRGCGGVELDANSLLFLIGTQRILRTIQSCFFRNQSYLFVFKQCL